MYTTIDMLDGSTVPKRGDLIQTNVGDRRERTWMILSVRELEPLKGVPRCRVWAERWWHLESYTRMNLFQSAERHGGQRVIQFKRYPSKRKPKFDDYVMRRS